MTVESQVSKSARPGAPQAFPLSTVKDDSRYARAEDVGHPPCAVKRVILWVATGRAALLVARRNSFPLSRLFYAHSLRRRVWRRWVCVRQFPSLGALRRGHARRPVADIAERNSSTEIPHSPRVSLVPRQRVHKRQLGSA